MKAFGLECTLAHDANFALVLVEEKLKRFGSTFKLILLDIIVDAWQVINEIHRILKESGLSEQARPYICLTTTSFLVDATDQARMRGFDNCLTKPILKANLRELLDLARVLPL